MTAPAAAGARTLVMKFGGTSVGSAAALTQVIGIVQQARRDWPQVVVITSALATVTNLLLASAAAAVDGDLAPTQAGAARLRQLHTDVAAAVIADPAARAACEQELAGLIDTFTHLCQAIAILGEATPRALDAVAALGERLAVRLLAAALAAAGVPAQFVEATRLIVTDDRFQNAHPDFAATTIQTQQTLAPLLAAGITPVVTGFIAAAPNGVTTTLGRGGSDYSAGILGAVLPAEEVWIWTDVDGVMSADPRLVPDALTIPEISYREISELAYFGAKVLHPKTIHPVVAAGVRVRICNTFAPNRPGTWLVAAAPPIRGEAPASGEAPVSGEIIKAVTAIRGLQLVTVEGRGMLGVPGVAARTFGAVAALGVSVPFITQASSEQTICFAIPDAAVAPVLAALHATFAQELAQQDIDRVWATEPVAIITIVGEGMIRTRGVAGRIFSAVGQAGVNVIAIAQGSSEVSISVVVAAADTEAAVGAIHGLILNGAAPHA